MFILRDFHHGNCLSLYKHSCPSPKHCKHDEMFTMKRQQSWPQKEEDLEHPLLVTMQTKICSLH